LHGYNIKGILEERVFGKVLDEFYQTAAWLHYSDKVMGRKITRLFVSRLAVELTVFSNGLDASTDILKKYRLGLQSLMSGIG